ncbi:hypothetical protein JGI20_01247, partial [Candidatus Kryptobacter tengchongensis]
MKTKRITKAEEIIKRLPELIETNESFRQRLFGILLEYFPSRQEYTQILKGIDEIIKRLEEHARAIKELSERQERHSQILEELVRGQERHSQILEEHARAIKELSERQERHSQILEEHARAIKEL